MESKYMRQQYDEKKGDTTLLEEDSFSLNNSAFIFNDSAITSHNGQYESFCESTTTQQQQQLQAARPPLSTFDFMKQQMINPAATTNRPPGTKQMKNGFVVYQQSNQPHERYTRDEDEVQQALLEMEQKLFGIKRGGGNFTTSQQSYSDSENIPVKTGTGVKLMKNGPKHIMDAEDFEPLYVPQDNILEDCLRREAERVAHQENLMNRVVYDSVDPAPNHLANAENQQISENEQLNNQESEDSNIYNNNISGYSDPKQCDNDQNLTPYYVPKSADDYTLVFESRIESGNLRRAIQVYEFEYDLILKPDYGTRGNTQWYYFRVQNTRPGRTYRFNIINLLKPDSLYNHGMQPLMYSEIEAKKFGKGWYRNGKDVCYYQNSMKRKTQGNYYTLTFTVKFLHENDTVYFAHSYPYTYSDLQRYLNRLEADPRKKLRFRRKQLCQTLAGNNVDMLIITSFVPQGIDQAEQIKQRKGVVISSRVHPGETGASFMVKGIIDYLVGPSLGARILRDNFVFKVIPMLNPDGVINGNTRCNLAGVDLNRQWIDPSKKLHPSIFHTKQMIKKFQEDREVFLVCDIHGHSRKKNIFMYGNSIPKNDKFKERVFPFLLEKQADTFSFDDCSFAVQKSKEATARVVIWKELCIQNAYTLEASFCGADFGKYADLHFNTDMLQEIGHRFCETIIQYCQLDQATMRQILEDVENLISSSSSNGGAQVQAEEVVPLGTGEGGADGGQPGGISGILNDNAGGGLGTIKDEDSNADSDFSGDEQQPPTGTAVPPQQQQQPAISGSSLGAQQKDPLIQPSSSQQLTQAAVAATPNLGTNITDTNQQSQLQQQPLKSSKQSKTSKLQPVPDPVASGTTVQKQQMIQQMSQGVAQLIQQVTSSTTTSGNVALPKKKKDSSNAGAGGQKKKKK